MEASNSNKVDINRFVIQQLEEILFAELRPVLAQTLQTRAREPTVIATFSASHFHNDRQCFQLSTCCAFGSDL